MKTQRLRQYWSAFGRTLHSPTTKQKEAYARYCHTLSAALLIAGGAIPFTSEEMTASGILQIAGASLLAIRLFAWGALLLEER